MKIKCIVIDDEYPARVLLRDYIKKVSSLELTGMYKNPVEAFSDIQEEKIDLVFLDIQMPELSGIEFLKTFTRKPNVIFTTAYADYALTGYELNVIDYLLKPISFERFLLAVQKAVQLINLQKGEKKESFESTNISEYIAIKADHKIYRVRITDILYIEGMREYVIFYTEHEKIISLESLKNLEEELPGNLFIRAHKSFIINKNKVKSLYGNQLEIGNKLIPVGKSYRDEVLKNIFP